MKLQDVIAGLGVIERRLRIYGMPRAKARAVVTELESDVLLAIREGQSAEQIVGRDPHRLAHELAIAHGYAAVESRILPTVFGAGIPMALVAFFAFVSVMGGGEMLGFSPDFLYVGEPLSERITPSAALFIHALTGVVTFLAAAGGVWVSLTLLGDERVAATIRRLAITLPVAAAIGIGSAMAIAYRSGFSTHLEVILAECMVVAAALVVGIAAARLWVWRIPARA